MKLFQPFTKAALFIYCLFLCNQGISQTTLKLEAASNSQGVEFDVPLRVQLPLNKKEKPFNVTIFVLKKSVYKKQLNKNDGDYTTGFSSAGSKPIRLSPLDKFEEVKDGNTVKYLLTLHTPVYLEPNKHYGIVVTNSFSENEFADKLKKVLLGLSKAHAQLIAGTGQEFTTEENNLLKKYNATDWRNIKAAIAAKPMAVASYSQASTDYTTLYSDLVNKYKVSGIPEPEAAADPEFYKIYQTMLILSKLKVNSDYTTATTVNISFPDLKSNTCLYDFLKDQLSCVSCKPNMPEAAILKDTTGLSAFIIDLLQASGKTKSFIEAQAAIVKKDELLSVFDKKDDPQLQSIFSKLEQLKLLMDFKRFSPADKCNPSLPDEIDKAYNAVKAVIDTREKEQKLKERFDSCVTSSNYFLHPVFYRFDTYVYNVDTRYGLRLTPDIGVINYGLIPGYNYNPGHITPYIGLQLNFRYTKANIPFHSIPGNHALSLRHFSAFLGVNVFSVKQAGRIDNLFGKGSLLLGIGYRFVPEIRMVIGTMLVKKIDPNPLISSTKTGSLPFIGVSFDTNKILDGLLKLF